MRRIVLKNLSLRNFKGVREFTLDLGGRSADIFAANAVGKTTLADAFTWLLFEKDSLGRKDFEIKTIDPVSGMAISGLEHEVEATFTVNGNQVTFKRQYLEKWTKPRGAPERVFSGHETQHFIDDVPMAKGEYTARVSELVDETTWRLLSDPRAFQQMHWQDRRRVLLDVCGDVTDQDVINSNSELADLPEILGDRSLDDHRKVIQARKAKINTELDQLPVRIDEVQRGLPAAPVTSREALEDQLEVAEATRTQVADRLQQAKSGVADTSNERRQLREVEGKLTDLEVAANREQQSVIATAKRAADSAHGDVVDAQENLQRLERRLATTAEDIERVNTRLVSLREAWAEVDARAIEAAVPGTCAACQQKLPADQVQAARQKAEADLNARKARELEQITADGNSLRKQHAEHEAAQQKLQADIEAARAALTRLQAAAEKAEQAAQRAEAAPREDVSETQSYIALAAERDRLTARIRNLETGDTSAITALEAELVGAEQAVAALKTDLGIWRQREAGEARTVELAEQERTFAGEVERISRELHLAEEFIRTKVNLLESRINDRFNTVRFQLFRTLVNGGLEEVCEATVNSVPYPSLNHAAQVQAGLEIISTLQEHHGTFTPVWVDGRESVTTLPEIDTQVVSLIVSEADTTFRVEVQKDQVAA